MQLINVTRVTNIIKDIQYIDFWNTPESSFTAAYDLLYNGIKFDVIVQTPNVNVLADEPEPDPDPDPNPDEEDPDEPDGPISFPQKVVLEILFVVDQQDRDLFYELAKNIYLNRIDDRTCIGEGMIDSTQEGYRTSIEFRSNIWSFRLEFN